MKTPSHLRLVDEDESTPTVGECHPELRGAECMPTRATLWVVLEAVACMLGLALIVGGLVMTDAPPHHAPTSVRADVEHIRHAMAEIRQALERLRAEVGQGAVAPPLCHLDDVGCADVWP